MNSSEELDLHAEREGTNNFFYSFPGGYNTRRSLMIEASKRRVEMVSDLHNLVSLCGFDVEILNEQDRLWTRKGIQASNLAGGDPEVVDALWDEIQQHRRNLDRIVWPFYKLMRELGYTYSELTS